MKTTITLSLQVPMGGYQLKFVNIYQTNKKLIAVSELKHRGGGGTTSICTIAAPHVVVDVSCCFPSKSIEHYVVSDTITRAETIEGGSQNSCVLSLWSCMAGRQTVNYIQSQNDIRDLITQSQCIYGTLPAELKHPEIKSEAKTDVSRTQRCSL